jgi:hypothetical protein
MSARLRSPWVLLFLVAGCSRAHAPTASPPEAPAAIQGEEESKALEPSEDLDALEHDFAVSERNFYDYVKSRETELQAQLQSNQQKADEAEGRSRAEAPRDSRPASKPAPKKERSQESVASGAPGAAVPAEPVPAAPAPPPPAAAADDSESFSACDLACRAFHSMRRSADRICEIAGGADARCTRARGRVGEASERITRAGCACRED